MTHFIYNLFVCFIFMYTFATANLRKEDTRKQEVKPCKVRPL